MYDALCVNIMTTEESGGDDFFFVGRHPEHSIGELHSVLLEMPGPLSLLLVNVFFQVVGGPWTRVNADARPNNSF